MQGVWFTSPLQREFAITAVVLPLYPSLLHETASSLTACIAGTLIIAYSKVLFELQP
jgi:hypothetical protein